MLSRLWIGGASGADSGNYSCTVPGLVREGEKAEEAEEEEEEEAEASPSSSQEVPFPRARVRVHVVDGEWSTAWQGQGCQGLGKKLNLRKPIIS